MDVSEAIARVDRKQFLPPDYAEMPGADEIAIPFGEGQTVPTAAITEFMLRLADLKPEHVVMEVGTGSGYQAAILAHLVHEVHSFEIRDPLPDITDRLHAFDNIILYHLDGTRVIPSNLKADRIIVTCGVPAPYRRWINVLEEGGILVCPLQNGEVVKYVKHGSFLEDMGPYAWADFVEVESPTANLGLIE